MRPCSKSNGGKAKSREKSTATGSTRRSGKSRRTAAACSTSISSEISTGTYAAGASSAPSTMRAFRALPLASSASTARGPIPAAISARRASRIPISVAVR